MSILKTMQINYNVNMGEVLLVVEGTVAITLEIVAYIEVDKSITNKMFDVFFNSTYNLRALQQF